MSTVDDGTGDGLSAKVSQNKNLHVFAVIETEHEAAIDIGQGFNLNTGTISLTAGTESICAYMKNTQDNVYVIDAIAVGQGNAATQTEMSTIKIYRNPTSVDFSTAGDQNGNMNFGSNLEFTGLWYKGTEGSTQTGGTAIAQFFSAEGTRLYATIPMEIPTGSSIAIGIDPNISSGTMPVYVALIGHFKDPKES